MKGGMLWASMGTLHMGMKLTAHNVPSHLPTPRSSPYPARSRRLLSLSSLGTGEDSGSDKSVRRVSANKKQSYSAAMETISKMQRAPTELEKILANLSSEKGVISKKYKELVPLNSKKTI